MNTHAQASTSATARPTSSQPGARVCRYGKSHAGTASAPKNRVWWECIGNAVMNPGTRCLVKLLLPERACPRLASAREISTPLYYGNQRHGSPQGIYQLLPPAALCEHRLIPDSLAVNFPEHSSGVCVRRGSCRAPTNLSRRGSGSWGAARPSGYVRRFRTKAPCPN